jgi:dephospho-CoA kinase
MRMKRITRYLDTRIVAVTGGMGSGQSTVSEFLAGLGCKVIDVDRKARQIVDQDQDLRQELKKVFGQDILDEQGQLKRRLLASLAFSDLERTQQLNRLVHPRMVAEIIEEMEEARFSRRYPLVVVDAALIYELNMEKMFDAVIVVHAQVETRVQRIVNRDKMDPLEIMARINRQIPLEDKIQWAAYTIDNNGTLEELKRHTQQVFERLIANLPVEKRIRI